MFFQNRMITRLFCAAFTLTVSLWYIVNFRLSKDDTRLNNSREEYLKFNLTQNYEEKTLLEWMTKSPSTEDIFGQKQHNSTWVELRKTLLADKYRKSRVLILSYMRGGSSFFYEMFNQDPSSSIVWYEPLDSFYSAYFGLGTHNIPLTLLYHDNGTRRVPDDGERLAMVDFLDRILSGRDYDEQLALDTLAHNFINFTSAFKPITSCIVKKMHLARRLEYICARALRQVCGLSQIRPDMSLVMSRKCHEQVSFIRSIDELQLDNETAVRDGLESSLSLQRSSVTQLVKYQHCARLSNETIRSCWKEARSDLDKATLIAAKLIRWSLTDIDDLLHRIPDLRIIHYVRDPRATVTSRLSSFSPMGILTRTKAYSLSEESKALCTRMRDDLVAKRALEDKYPGAVLTVRYEDFVLSTAQTVEQVFKFVGRPPPVGIRWWLRTSMHGRRDNGRYGTVRANSSMLVDNWKRKVSYSNATEMSALCRDVLRDLGYEL